MSYYADFILTREHARRIPHQSWLDVCDRWLSDLRWWERMADETTPEIEMRRTHGKNGLPAMEAVR